MRRTGQTPYYSEYYQNIFKRNWIKIFHFFSGRTSTAGTPAQAALAGDLLHILEELLIFFFKLIKKMNDVSDITHYNV